MSTMAGVGLATDADAARAGRIAARQALERCGAGRADWGVVFATSPHRPHFGAVLAEVQGTLGTDFTAGCSAWGVVADGQEVEGRPAVAVLAVRSDRIGATTLFAALDRDHPEVAAREIGRQIGDGSPPGLLVLLPDPLAVRPDLLLEAIGRASPGREAIGAAASGDPSADGTFQFYGRNVATRSLSGLHLKGEIRSVIGITQGCQPMGDPCRVTRGDGNVILELDGRPAIEVLRSRLPGALRDSLGRLGAHLLLGMPPDPSQERILPGEYLVRPLVGADQERGALVAGATIREGQLVMLVLREAQAAREDLKEMLRRVRQEADGIGCRFGFYFNCAARGTSLHGVPGVDSAYISGSLGDLPIIGFFGNAEIAPLRGANFLFTHTGVLALVGEVS
jgi:small ligand-binding sensory domain FIST